MIKRFFYSCILSLSTLLCFVADGSAQSDTTRFLQDTVRLGNILPGSMLQDTTYLRLAGQARDVTFTPSDTALRVLIQNPYTFNKLATDLAVIFQIIPRKFGPDTLYLAAVDTSRQDTLVLIFNSEAQTNFRFSRDSVKVGQLLLGATVTESFYVVSLSNDLKIDNISIPDSAKDSLSISAQPFRVREGDSSLVTLSITPKTVGPRAIHLIFQDSSGVSRTAVLTLEGILPSAVDTIFSLSEPKTLARVSEEDQFTMILRLRNDTPGEIVINNFTIDDTVNFGIEAFPLLPLILDAGSSTPPVEVYAKKTGPGFFRTNVRVPSDGGLASEYTVGVQVLKIMQGSVAPIVSKTGITVYQSGTEIAIDAIPFETGRLEIFDLLGRMIVTHPITSSQMFISKLDATGSRMEDGCYILRLTDAKGRHSEAIKVLLVSY